MAFMHKYKEVARCCLTREALEREGMAGEHDVESHELGSPEIIRDPLVFGNPTSQQTWKSRYFFIGGEWEFPAGSEPSVKRVPCHFAESPGRLSYRAGTSIPTPFSSLFFFFSGTDHFPLCAVDQSWGGLPQRQEKEIGWIREHISIVLRRSTVLLNRYSLERSGLAPAPKPCEYCSVVVAFNTCVSLSHTGVCFLCSYLSIPPVPYPQG